MILVDSFLGWTSQLQSKVSNSDYMLPELMKLLG